MSGTAEKMPTPVKAITKVAEQKTIFGHWDEVESEHTTDPAQTSVNDPQLWLFPELGQTPKRKRRRAA